MPWLVAGAGAGPSSSRHPHTLYHPPHTTLCCSERNNRASPARPSPEVLSTAGTTTPQASIINKDGFCVSLETFSKGFPFHYVISYPSNPHGGGAAQELLFPLYRGRRWAQGSAWSHVNGNRVGLTIQAPGP